MKTALFGLLVAVLALGCRLEAESAGASPTATTDGLGPELAPQDSVLRELLAQYATVRLDPDLSGLSDSTRRMIPLLIRAAQAMDDVFWVQAYGDRDSLLGSLDSEAARRYVQINAGPWDRLDGDAPFLPDVGPRPAGANLYPRGLDPDELLSTADLFPERGLTSPYTLVRRGERGLTGVPYAEAFAEAHGRAAAALRGAAALAPDSLLARFLALRADALLTDRYRASDSAWVDLHESPVDVVLGPIETYEDGLTGFKATHGAYVLLRDTTWSARLRRVAALLPALQRELPVDSAYRAGPPAVDVRLGAYDVLYAAGYANAGPKVIALDLPNDPTVRRAEGHRRLQLQNVMRAKFDRVLVPAAERLLPEDQRERVTFEAFFGNAMFHEVAHGLGTTRTVSGRASVREALDDRAAALEEAKADVLGFWLVQRLIERGEWDEATLDEHAVTFVASVFRAVRFGAAGARGRAALVRFNVLRDEGAVVPESTPEGEVWRVVPERVGPAVEALARRILTLQGDGDYAAADAFVRRYGRTSAALAEALDRLAGVPVDVVFEQGADVLGLEPTPTPARPGGARL